MIPDAATRSSAAMRAADGAGNGAVPAAPRATPVTAPARPTAAPAAPDASPASRFAGVVAAMITPCAAPGQVDVPATARLAGILVGAGCDGLFVVSSTGESVLLDEDERLAVIAAARSGCPAEAVLYAGVSGMGLKQTIRQARAAAAEGADAVVVMAPFFVRVAQSELRQFVLSVADASPVPVCIYHHWKMPTAFEVETIAALAGHPNVVAAKDTSDDPQRVQAVVAATRHTRLTLLHGNERLILHTLRAGGHGCVSALATVAPEWHRRLLQAWRRGDLPTAERMQQSIHALWQMFAFEPTRQSFSRFVHALKRTAQLRGWLESTAGMVPGVGADAEFDRLIERHVREVGLLDNRGRD